jgi:hypothetical protein
MLFNQKSGRIADKSGFVYETIQPSLGTSIVVGQKAADYVKFKVRRLA